MLSGLALLSVFGGVWWFIQEPKLEPALAFIVGLVGLFTLWKAQENEKEQAQDKVETFKKLDDIPEETSNRVATKNEELLQKAQQQREVEQKANQQLIADKKLLRDMWKFINWRDLNTIVDQIHYGAGDYDYYKEKIIAYLYFREENQERQLQFPELGKALSEFDNALHRFDRHLSLNADAEPKRDRWIWFPHYKYPMSQENYEYKHGEYRKAVDYGMEMLDKQQKLVSVIRDIFPDFFEN